MPDFTNPFPGMIPDRQMSRDELIRALRLDLAAEEDAVHLYTAHADATSSPIARKVLQDIADEERVHAGELLRLIGALNGDEQKFILQGYDEVNKKFPDIQYSPERARR